MAHFNRFPVLLAAIAAVLLVGCSDGDKAQQEADQVAERTEESIEQAPATQQQPQQQQAATSIPAPENVAAPPGDAETTPGGVAYLVLEDAAGDVRPTTQDTVTVHYTGWTTDGQMFDSSVARGEPATFPLGSLIPGWQEAVPVMTVGDKYRFWIPGNLAYDGSSRPGAPKGMLVFDIELLGVNQQAEPQRAADSPDDTESGNN